MTLGELLDLELQLSAATRLGAGERRARDESAVQLMRRDRAAGRPQDKSRAALLRTWLRATAATDKMSPGQTLDRTVKGTDIALVAAGLFAGGSSAAALFAYDGSHPVNIIYIVAVFVGAQIATLLLLLTQALPGGVLRPRVGQAPPSLLHRVLKSFLHGRLRAAPAFGRLFAPVEAWRLLVFTQLFGTAFNLAALAVTIAIVATTDVAFSWSTTLHANPEALLRLVQALALPWGGFLSDAVPTKELVEATQYFRLKAAGAGQFVKPGSAQFYGGWWPFLAACITFYGLLPRALLLTLALGRYKAARMRVVLTNLEFERLAQHINNILFSDDTASTAANASLPASVLPANGLPCGIVLWRDLPFAEPAVKNLVQSITGSSPRFLRHAGGTARDLDAAEAVGAIKVLPHGTTVIVVDIFATLDKALRRFIEGLRAGLGPQARILVLPLAGAGDRPEAPHPERDLEKLGVWRRALRDFGDPAVALAEGR